MSLNINKTKSKLAIVFATIVFVVVFLLGLIFFSTKYYNAISTEKTDFSYFINLIESKKITIENMLNFGPKFDSFNNINKIIKFDIKNPDLGPREFMNYVLFDGSGSLVSSNVKDNVTEDFILNIINNKSFYNIKQDSGFLVNKTDFNDDGLLIVFKKLRYGFYEYLEDIFTFTIISLLFSILIYYIGIIFVNKVFVPVEENIKDMSNFIDNAGHELKTPISVIDSNIQLINELKTYDETMMLELKGEVKKLNSLIDSLVKLSNIDVFRDVEDINLYDAVNEIINDFKSKIDNKKITVNIKINKKITVSSNKNYLYIFLSNIIGNSIKYNKIMGIVDINYKNNTLIIKDTGVGIKKSDLSKIWDRFFKSDNSRNSEGFGIGLSLVKKIGDIYGWNMSVNSKVGEGSEFSIKF
ncbi:MAG: HAMP domain-containing sensor histidine kinase [Candidatus Gracilibacteria bacterium]|nr:HAMP domain-containing sensor histidine kinase [Candidatus Gracilibacteria bacterium]